MASEPTTSEFSFQGPLQGPGPFHYMHDTEVRDKEDVVLAWLRYNKDCAKMRIGEGLMDRDLGTSDWDGPMESFLRNQIVNIVGNLRNIAVSRQFRRQLHS